MSEIERSIKAKIEAVGTPLKDWDISINYGIKTGYNNAFIIDGSTKDRLIAEDPKSSEIIHPLLRGRDIKRYGYEFADKWIIYTHNGTQTSARVDVENYPAIKKHLDNYYPQLEKRCDKGDTPYNLRSCAYTDDFFKQKIVYNDIAQKLTFGVAEAGVFFNNTVYFMTVSKQNNQYLLAILNSKLIDWYYRKLSVQLGSKAVRMFSIYVNQIPIPMICQEQIDIINLRMNYKDVDNLDQIVYNLYNLTPSEIEFIDSQ